MTEKIVVLSLVFPYLYLLLGRVARSEFIENGWFSKNHSLLIEVIMSPIFVVWGIFIYLKMILSFTPIIIGGGICSWLIIYIVDLFSW